MSFDYSNLFKNKNLYTDKDVTVEQKAVINEIFKKNEHLFGSTVPNISRNGSSSFSEIQKRQQEELDKKQELERIKIDQNHYEYLLDLRDLDFNPTIIYNITILDDKTINNGQTSDDNWSHDALKVWPNSITVTNLSGLGQTSDKKPALLKINSSDSLTVLKDIEASGSLKNVDHIIIKLSEEYCDEVVSMNTCRPGSFRFMGVFIEKDGSKYTKYIYDPKITAKKTKIKQADKEVVF